MSSQVSSDSSASLKPWSSGRVLTPRERERKRHKDRINKRAKSAKQKDEIQTLQSQIKVLQDLIQTQLGLATTSLSIDFPRLSSSVPPSVSPPGLFPSSQDIASIAEVPLPPESLSTPIGLETENSHRKHFENCGLKRDPLYHISSPIHGDNSSTILHLGNEIFGKVSELDARDICIDYQMNHDVIIRGVLEGWHTLQRWAYLCPLWSLLKQVDEGVFMHAGILTRFSMLKMVHNMLLATFHADCYACLPLWYRPRPTQIHFPHQATSDYFAWPGFRERLVVSNCEILTDRFFKLFASSFRLLWPFSIGDAYEFDFLSGQYGFTNGFLSHIRDIRVWTMSREFFQEFPELEDDMTVESPVCVQLPDTLKKDTKQGML